MATRSAARLAAPESPKIAPGFLCAVAAAIVCPFDFLLCEMIRSGLGVEAICAYLGFSLATLDYNITRLHLPAPHDKPRRRGGRRPWSDEDLRFAIYWRCLGVHPESIGIVFGRSAASVRSKMRRLGVPTPDRKKLHKVDARTLDRTPPDFGFPAPPAEPPAAVSTVVSIVPPGDSDVVSIVPSGDTDVAARRRKSADPKPARAGRKAVVSGQRDLNLLSVVPPHKPVPAAAPEPAGVDVDAEPLPEKPVSVCTTVAPEMPRVIGPADLIERYRVAGKIRRQESNEAYIIWLTLLYRGGMHYQAIAAYLDRSPSAVQAILNRTQIPRARDRAGFGWTCDLESAVAEMKTWKFELYRCKSKPDLPEPERPLFWRRKGDVGNRRRRCVRLKNREIDDYAKYKGGHSVEFMRRAEVEGHPDVGTGMSLFREPARLQPAMQGSFPVQQGAAHEQFELRGHTPVVGSGFSGLTGDPMPWAHPGNGGASRPVAHP